MAGQNYPVPPLPNFDPLDIANLGTVMLEVAGLPLSAVQLERKWLMITCAGRYFGCQPRSQILPSTGGLSIQALCEPHNRDVSVCFGSLGDMSAHLP